MTIFKKNKNKTIKTKEEKRDKKMCVYVRDREAGNLIETVSSIAEAQNLIERYEFQDKKDGIFEENFYEICFE